MNQESKDYFGRPAGEPGEPGLFLHIADLEPVLELAPGITTRPIVGTNLLASFVRYEPNAVAPLHSHVEEQLFMVFEGEIELELSGERRVLRPGDAALIPAWVPHSARAVGGPAYQLDVFSPPRRAMLDMIAKLGS
jgi:quercetin dioxygenase-like cupin family protein